MDSILTYLKATTTESLNQHHDDVGCGLGRNQMVVTKPLLSQAKNTKQQSNMSVRQIQHLSRNSVVMLFSQLAMIIFQYVQVSVYY